MKTLYLCGARNPEGVRLALRINEKYNRWEKIIILDDDPDKHGRSILEVEIAGSLELLEQVDPNTSEVVNLVARTTVKRQLALQKIKEYCLPFAPLIDPSVDICGVEFSKDIAVYQNVTFSAGAFVDEGSVIFTGAAVGHGCQVGRCCVIAPGAVINARVQVGDGAYIGTNASILPDLKIGDWATVGLNSGVVQDVPAGATVMGVPAQIVMMSEGNIKEKALQKSDATIPKLDKRFRVPETETEKMIAEIWSKVLNLEKAGTDDNFFDLGGNSLSAVQIAFQIQKTFNVDVPLQMFFNSPTITALSGKIDGELSTIKDEKNDLDKTAEALKKLKQLTKEEKEALLSRAEQSKKMLQDVS